MPDLHPLLAPLADPSPAVVADALRKVRFRDLKDPAVFDAVLRACADERAVDGATVQGADPFAAFFSEAPRSAATLAAIAADRLEKAGVPEDVSSAERLAAVLDGLTTAGPLGPVAAKILATTRWPDPVGAVRAVVPALCRHDVSLFQVLVALPSAAVHEICLLAASPFRPRLFQELLNHAPSQDDAVAAVVAAVGTGGAALDEAAAVTLLSTLAAWNRKETPRVAAALEPTFPLALAWRALDEEAARPTLAAAIADPARPLGDVGRFWPRVAEVLRAREPLAGYPVAGLLRATGADPGVVAALGVDDEVEVVLHEWVAGHAADVDRAWAAGLALLGAGRLGRSRATLEGLLGGGDPAEWPVFESPVVQALCALQPPLSGWVDACCSAARLDPSVIPDVSAAIGQLDDGAVARWAGAVLDLAEAAPRVIVRLSAKAVQDRPAGVEVDALEPLLGRLHPSAAERFERVRMVVRAG